MPKRTRSESSRPVTTEEIARLSGVSRSTVSAVLNGKRNVRESTRQKVLECIREQNYGSGMIAHALVGELSRMVGVLAVDLGSPFHMMYFAGIQEVLEAEGYHILFHNVLPEGFSDPETLASLSAYRPAGYIILKGAEGPNGEHARAIMKEGVPLVSEGVLQDVQTHCVYVEDRLPMKQATDYVIARGHRRLAHLAGPKLSTGARNRKMGFLESLIEHDIPVAEATITDAWVKEAGVYNVARDMLKNAVPKPTAVLCFNDMTAMAVYRAAHELGLDIPHDLSVVGFDGVSFTELMGPPLTTVNTFPTERGRRAARLLLRVIRNQVGRGFVAERMEARLEERASVRQLKDIGHPTSGDGLRVPVQAT